MGQPLKIEELGETEISQEVFQDYLRSQGSERFSGDKYDLFHHNCNNFSHETAQFLVGRGIPQHIIDLPGEILATPMGQMIAPMLQQMTPQGTSIPFTNQSAPDTSSSMQSSAASNTTQSSEVKFPMKEFSVFDQQLKVDGLTRKLEEFNCNQSEESKLSESELKIVLGVAKGLVRLSQDNFSVLTKISSWKKCDVFPLLDILRFKCVRNTFESREQVETVVKIFEENLSPDYKVNSMLSVRGLVNMVRNPEWRTLVTTDIVNTVLSMLPTDHSNLEISIATLLFNLSVCQTSERDLDTCILLASGLVMQVLPVLSQDEAVFRALSALGNIVVTGQEEVAQFLLSLEATDTVNKFKNKDHKMVAASAQAVLKMLSSAAGGDNSNGGLDLD